jgi:hypothetical protein
MVRLLTTRGHEYTVRNLVQRKMQGADVPPCKVENYDLFLRKKEVPCGVYIFMDIERLTPFELRMAAEAYAALAGDSRCRALNNPARVMCRYELLRNLREEGINEFDVIRADERRWPNRFPVFLRYEQDHRGPLSADLIYTREELATALEKVRAEGISLRGLLIVEYAAEAFEGVWFRKFNTFRIGKEVFAHHMVAEDTWVVKYGKENVEFPDKNKLFEQEFVKGNWNADFLRRAFEIARIDYGRADWGVVAGRTQIYEINTNPHVSADPGTSHPTRQATIAMSTKKLCESLSVLDNSTRKGRIKISGKALDEWRNGKRWYERAERRP